MRQDRAIEMARQAGFTYGFGRADIEKFNRLYQLARNDGTKPVCSHRHSNGGQMTSEIMRLADAYAKARVDYTNCAATLGEVADARDALHTTVKAAKVDSVAAAQDEIARLKYQIELRRSQFESAEFAVNELKRERDILPATS